MHTMARALLTEIEAFLAESGLTPTKFGLTSVNDGHLVANLRRGNSVTLKTADRVRAFMALARRPRARGCRRWARNGPGSSRRRRARLRALAGRLRSISAFALIIGWRHRRL